MASSAVTGDRRWGGSARRGGMTVLGKVAVPKPLNLPSQRLENHGLDPSVEIVPKGTLSWGSRPSSAGSNAWGTSALSPTTDGSSCSPRHLIGRPSSGGGSRPSTAGSEGAHDTNVSAWGSNSRPSSASGVLASNSSSSASLRPRSAETRPGSSHLSRFAEPAPEGPGIRGTIATSERTGVVSSTKEGFSLTSGDFPTLGSEKEESKRNMEPLDLASHGRPGSSGGLRREIDSRGSVHGDGVSRNSDVKGNSWKKYCTPFVEDGPRPSMERWHGEPHLYPNPNMGPHYESWRGAPPVNPPGGVWYRGPPGPPYGGPVPPGGFPMEPFPYYHPQVPAPGLANSQPIPPGAGHHGHHPKNGDMPHMAHVPHMHPGIPMRPGFYPVPYDGYYRPPMGFCNPNEHDLPFMGIPPGAPVYTRHANQNAPDLINTHPRSHDVRGPDQVEPCHPPDTRGQYKVLASRNDVWNHDEEEKRGHRMTNSASASIHDKGILSKPPMQENAWEDDFKKDEDISYGNSTTIPVLSHSSDNMHGKINHSHGRFSERLSNIDEAQINPSMERGTSQDHSLIQKIEGLNVKARGKQEDFHREEHNDRVQKVNAKDYVSSNEVNSDVLERHYPSGVLVPVSRNIDVSTVDKSQEAVASATAASRRSMRGSQIKGDPHAKGKFHGQMADGRGKNSDSHFVPEGSSRSTFKDQQEHNAAVQISESPWTSNVLGKVDGEPVMPGIDTSDIQRAKMRDIAKQRAIQLQKEEEERVKEQKAKALAKLEELNRRSVNQGTENPNQKETTPICAEVPKRQDVSKNLSEASLDLNYSSTGPGTGSPNNIAQLNERSGSKIVDSAVASSHVGAESKSNVYKEDSISSQNQVPIADTYSGDAASCRSAPQVREVSKQKRGGYKQRQNVPSEKTSLQDTISVGSSDVLKDLKIASSTQEATGSLVDAGVGKEQAELPVTAEFPHQKKKTNKSGKSRPKVEDSPAAISPSVTQPKDFSLSQASQAVPENSQHSGSGLHDNSTLRSADPKDAIQSSENYSSLSREGTHGRGNSSWKAQHSRKPKNPQGNRSSEKTHSNDAVVWAPVRSHNKVEVSDQSSQKTAEHFVSSAAGDNFVHNTSKTKRAEMERYVPKPVAKDLGQQGHTQQTSSPSVDPAATDGSIGREKASHVSENVMKAGANMEHKHVDGKNKNPKAQGSWRQRGSAESTSVQASQNSSAANTRLDESFVRGPLSRPDECLEKVSHANISDGWEISNDSSSTFTGEKDRIPSGRGKRHPFKGHKDSESHQNFDHKDSNAILTNQFSNVEANQIENTASSKENRAAGERSVSHWQPKPQGYVVHNQQGSRFRGGQNIITEDRRALKSDIGPVSSHPQPRRMQSAAKDPTPASDNKGAGEVTPSTEIQEGCPHSPKRDPTPASGNKRVQPVKGRLHSPKREEEATAGEIEPTSLGAVDGRNEQRPSSGYRKSANNSGRFNRGYEFRGDWSSTAQENKQHYSSANKERQRQNSHYEYQPVGPYNGSSRQNEPMVQTESQSGASRFRERGQGNNSRRGRGNFYGRQSGKE